MGVIFFCTAKINKPARAGAERRNTPSGSPQSGGG